MKRTIEIDDTLWERVEQTKEEVRQAVIDYVIQGGIDDLDNIDDDGTIHQIVDSNVPIYYHEIDALHYLHGNELEEAYENAGIGDGKEENWKAVAIYCLLDQEAQGYLQALGEEYKEWLSALETPPVPEGEEAIRASLDAYLTKANA